MSLLNPERNFLHPPTGGVLNSPAQAQVVFSLKQKPPFNFNLTLNQHALEHGLKIQYLGFHPHPTGTKLSVKLGGQLDNAKRFADSAVSKFGVYLHSAEVSFEKHAANLKF